MRWIEFLSKIAPKAYPNYLNAFELHAERAFSRFLINTPGRLAHFLAQVLHESGGLTRTEENLNYTTAARLHAVFPKYFPTEAAAAPYVRNPQALANRVYANRMGNISPGDGWTFRGRGMIQITGRAMYARVGELIGQNLVGTPELVYLSDCALDAACAVWSIKGCNAFADAGDIIGVTKRINGGLNGLEDRSARLAEVEELMGSYDA